MTQNNARCWLFTSTQSNYSLEFLFLPHVMSAFVKTMFNRMWKSAFGNQSAKTAPKSTLQYPCFSRHPIHNWVSSFFGIFFNQFAISHSVHFHTLKLCRQQSSSNSTEQLTHQPPPPQHTHKNSSERSART